MSSHFKAILHDFEQLKVFSSFSCRKSVDSTCDPGGWLGVGVGVQLNFVTFIIMSSLCQNILHLIAHEK